MVILCGWQELTGATSILTEWRSAPFALNAHALPILGALVYYLHDKAGFPFKSTWLTAINAGNIASWPGVTLAKAAK